ncbi:hypothetical protein LSP04_01390 [Levilactobacillus spicheri]|uniref:Uncharacterized protein n=1 Tax=Levilactobacillus spicheri TaxID=216463 RepID=A0ABQ0WM55_9LACO|nr:hypothetical protein LSP04_01390 [Levilactobacillus spicheri]
MLTFLQDTQLTSDGNFLTDGYSAATANRPLRLNVSATHRLDVCGLTNGKVAKILGVAEHI